MYSLEERYTLTSQLDEKILDGIIGYHIQCLFERERMISN